MQSTGSASITDRIMGFLRLDERTIRDVERDTNATGQALIVVVLAAIASAIGNLGPAADGERETNFVLNLLSGSISAIVGWIVFSVLAYYIGSTLFSTAQTSATIGQLLRTVGFAQAPKLLMVLGFIPIFGWIVGLVATIWFVAVAIVAIRTALELTTERAVATAILSLIGYLIALVIVGLIFALVIGVPLLILDAIF